MNDSLDFDIVDVETADDISDCSLYQKVRRSDTPEGSFEVYIEMNIDRQNVVTIRKDYNILSINVIPASGKVITSTFSPGDKIYDSALREYNKGVSA